MKHPGIFLEKSEVAEMTGYKVISHQRGWCARNGVIFKQRSDGSLVILRDHLALLLGAVRPKS